MDDKRFGHAEAVQLEELMARSLRGSEFGGKAEEAAGRDDAEHEGAR